MVEGKNMKNIILLKLGGSLITDKSKPFTARMHIIEDLARQIKEALNENPQLQLVIGNGSGSFAHYPAVQYKMNGKIINEDQKMGFGFVQDAASQLNRIIVLTLLKAGVRAISLNPSSMIISKGGKIKKFFIEPVINLLNLGMTPVLYGDIVYDETLGAKIYSTEQLLTEIAMRFKKRGIIVKKIIHNGATKGVLDQKGELIPTISRKNFSSLKKVFSSIKGFDVTGGMLHKVEESLKLADSGFESLIINGFSKKNLLKDALLGKKVIGTHIYG